MKNHASVRALACALSFAASVAGCPEVFAAEKSVPMLPDESWWGLAGGFGRRMPFDAPLSRIPHFKRIIKGE